MSHQLAGLDTITYSSYSSCLEADGNSGVGVSGIGRGLAEFDVPPCWQLHDTTQRRLTTPGWARGSTVLQGGCHVSCKLLRSRGQDVAGDVGCGVYTCEESR